MTLPAALSELDRALADLADLRAKVSEQRGELENVYALLRAATANAAALAIELEQAHAEREMLRDSVESTTALVAELSTEKRALARRVEHLTGEAAVLRAASYR